MLYNMKIKYIQNKKIRLNFLIKLNIYLGVDKIKKN